MTNGERMQSQCDGEVRPMEYPVLAGTPASVLELDSPMNLAKRVRELEAKLEEKERQLARKLASAMQAGVEQGKRQAGDEQTAWREQCTGQLTTALAEFCAKRDEYLARVEHEVVRLALAVAERILHREVQLDPLLLAGAVRVALGQLAESTEVRLRVPAGQKEMWAEMVRLAPGLALRPQVQADEKLEAGEAALETKMGTVDLGIRAQLGEIERGFFDLLEVRNDSRNGDGLDAAGKRE
ncbi:MAG: FliH/SctL family protein [Acidobacteriaceae bacterium]|jgi:flagellar assembly protein FliH